MTTTSAIKPSAIKHRITDVTAVDRLTPSGFWAGAAKIMHSVAKLFCFCCQQWIINHVVKWASPAYWNSLQPVPALPAKPAVQDVQKVSAEVARPKKKKKAKGQGQLKVKREEPARLVVQVVAERAPSPVALSQPSSPKDKNPVISRFQARLKTLENDPAKIREFLADVERAGSRDPSLGTHLNPLKNALRALANPRAFQPEEGEGFHLPPYREVEIASIANMARSDFLKAIKRLDLFAPGNAKKIREEFEAIGQNALRQRIQSALPHASETVITNQVSLHLARQRFQASTGEFVDLMTNSIHARYDARTGGRFSKIIHQYSYNDLAAVKPMYLENARMAFTRFCDQTFRSSALLSQDPAQFEKALAQIEAQCKGVLEESILENISKNIEPFYDWLLANGPYLKKPYNQGNDHNKNMGEGTCLQNSVDRVVLLNKTPMLRAAEIHMGSTEHGRYMQGLINAEGLHANSPKLIAALEASFGQPCKLVSVRLKAPVDQLLEMAKVKPILGLFEVYDKEGGHAMTVQIDPEKNIFRLIDDNLGVLEYPSEKEFREQISQYLALSYSRYPTSYLKTFQPAAV